MEITAAKDSGIIRSRSLSPAERIFRPRDPAVLDPFGSELVKFVDSRDRCWVVLRATVFVVGADDVRSSVCNLTMRRKDGAGRYSLACIWVVLAGKNVYNRNHFTHQPDQAIGMEGMLTGEHIKLSC